MSQQIEMSESLAQSMEQSGSLVDSREAAHANEHFLENTKEVRSQTARQQEKSQNRSHWNAVKAQHKVKFYHQGQSSRYRTPQPDNKTPAYAEGKGVMSQLWRGLKNVLGYGSIATDHPMYYNIERYDE